jgi:translation initiation factor IF-2
VFAVDGSVTQVGGRDAQGKWPVALKMHGLTVAVRERLARLVRDGREGLLSALTAIPPPPGNAAPVAPEHGDPAPTDPEPTPAPYAPPIEPLVPDEAVAAPAARDEVHAEDKDVHAALAQYHEDILRQATHEILGVAYDADLRAVRAAYFTLARHRHPDVYGRYRSPGVRALASEVFVHINRAYDRLRADVVARSGAAMPGPAATGGAAWLVDEDDVRPAESVELEAETHHAPAPASPAPAPPAPAAPAAVAAPPPAPHMPIAAGTPVPRKTLADELFGDLGAPPAPDDQPFDAVVPASTERSASLANAGRAALAAGQCEVAQGHFAAALKLDPRNRPVRALYHVASGLLLRARGQHTEAQLQLESALAHDPTCAEALRALGLTARRA